MMNEPRFELLMGVDWGNSHNQMCLMEASGKIVVQKKLANDAQALSEWIDQVLEHVGGDTDRVAAAIEVPHGPVVETLMARGIAVFAINPKQSERFRDRFSPSGAKDDRRDAHVLADALRTDRRAFRQVEAVQTLQLALREEVRIYNELKEQRRMAVNRLRSQLMRFYPQMLSFGEPDAPWIWALIEKAPTPVLASALNQQQIKDLLRIHRIRRVSADDVLEKINAKPFDVADGVADAASTHITVLIEQLRLLHGQTQRCERRMKEVIERYSKSPASPRSPQPELSDAEIFDSLPGTGIHVVAAVLGEAGALLRERNLTRIRELGGAPVTRATGKMKPLVVMRRACNPILRDAFFYWGKGAMQSDARCRQRYHELRKRGQSHGRAIRGVVDRLLDVLMAMLRDRTRFEPQKYNRLKEAA
jgi:transposase